jgi:signal peptidase I
MDDRGAANVTTVGSDAAGDRDSTAVLPPERPRVGAADETVAGGAPPGDDGGAGGNGGGGEGGSGKRRPGRSSTKRVAIEWVVLIAVALSIAFVIKTFAFQAFYIPSGSMEPTLMIGDRVLVNKLSYDFHDVNRGDIIVFDAPPGARTADISDLVKRVIGLPGDTVTFPGDGHVYVNGKLLREPYLSDKVMTCNPSLPCPTTGTGSTTVDTGQHVPPGCGTPANNGNGCTVPKDHLLVLGDNRESSRDGRVFGVINESSIVGRVFLRIWPIGSVGFL